MKKNSLDYKSGFGFFALFAFTVIGSVSSAKNLTCWNVYSKMTQKPVIQAEILKHDKLKSVKISDAVSCNLSKDPSVKGSIQADVVSNKKINAKDQISTKDQRHFKLSKEAQLILPSNLEPNRLQSSSLQERTGRKINGLLMLKNAKSSASYTIKLYCQSI